MAPLARAERVLFDADGAGNGAAGRLGARHGSTAGQGARRGAGAESA